jgi:hypothetical protein
MGKENVPPEAFKNIMALAQRLLSAKEWAAVRSHF